MTVLRWILAFPVGVVSWIYFPYLCSLSLPPSLVALGPDVFSYGAAALLFLNPIVALGIFFLILPPGNRSALVTGIVTFSIICTIGTFLLSFLFFVGGGPPACVKLLLLGITGTIIGAGIAYALMPLKTNENSEK